MHDITKHDAEQKWEGHSAEKGRIGLLVAWDTIGINYLLECPSKVIQAEQCWLGETRNVFWALLIRQSR